MKVKYLFFAGLVSMMAWSCSDDELQGGGNDKPTDAKTYMEISINMPAATRTATPDQGQEEGQEFENHVGSVLVVLVEASKDESGVTEDKIVFAQKVTEGAGLFNEDGKKKVKIEDVKGLELDRNTKEKGYTVYAFVNPTAQMTDYYTQAVKSKKSWKEVRDGAEQANAGTGNAHDFIQSMTFDGYAKLIERKGQGQVPSEADAGHFLMTDTRMNTVTGRTEPASKTISFIKEVSTGKYLLEGSTNVERAVARFDYAKAKADNIYSYDENWKEELYASTTWADKSLYVQLTHYKVMNVAKQFYHLKRVAPNEKVSSEVWSYGGAETKENFVVDSDWKLKLDYLEELKPDIPDTWATQGIFFDPLNGEKTDAPTSYLPLIGLFDDTDDWQEGMSQATTDLYEALCYCTENTIPTKEGQIHPLTTAIVFRAEIGGSMVNNADKGLYRFNRKIYNKWDEVQKAYNKAYPDAEINVTGYEELTGDENLLAAKKLITYWPKQSDNDTNKKIVCYYSYWNRHNDNGKPTEMGPMEFAVVRNNIYKLKVSKILKLGDPVDPTNPEGEVFPPDPDESQEISMEVEVNVLKWAVRVNDIEFD